MRSKEIVINENLIETLIESRDRIGILIEEIGESRIEKSKVDDIIYKINELSEVNAIEKCIEASSRSEIAEEEKNYQSEDSVVYEEDTDAELFDIFIEQTQEGLNYLKKRFITISRNSSKESTLKECFDKLESLKKSAHYMSYDRLVNVYAEWIEELKEIFTNGTIKNIGMSISDHCVGKIKIIEMMFPKINVFEDLISIKHDNQTEIDRVENNQDLDGKYSIELNKKIDPNKVELPEDGTNYLDLTDHIKIDEVKIDEIEDKEFVNSAEKFVNEPIVIEVDEVLSDENDLEDIASPEAPEVDDEASSAVMDLEDITSPEAPEVDDEASSAVMDLEDITSPEAPEVDDEAPLAVMDLEDIASPEAPEIDDEASSDVMDLESITSVETPENTLPITETDDDDLIELSEIVSEDYFGDDPEYSKRMDEFILRIENDIDTQIDSRTENIKEDYPKIKKVESPGFEQNNALEIIDPEINKFKTYSKTTDTEKEKNKETTGENAKSETSISSETPSFENNQGRYEIDDSYFNRSFPEDILASLHAEFDLSKAENNFEFTKAIATSDEKDLGKDDEKLSPVIDKVSKSEKLAERPLTQSVRVDAAKIDALINQVGEIVVNRAFFSQLYNDMRMFEYYLRQNENIEKRDLKQIKELTFRMNEATMSLSRMTNDLQEKVMRVRMLPISQLFNRYPRLVHDLVRGVDKKVKLDIIGEDTELDRIVIERISDPLVHIIRNSIDHGIETITERERSGKPTIGTLRLEAYHEGNHVVIKVIDDGKGIDIERIKKKALEKQLLAYDEIERMSDKELTSLIMQPGFSTAPEITRTSGRGVGMDVVKKNVEKLNGTLEVESIFGVQTQIQIKIPLTLAIIPALLVGVSDDLFTIPLSTVDETIRLNKNNIFKIEGIEVFHLRDETIPLLRLTEVFNIESKKETDKEFAVIVKTGDTQIGLVVDELLGREEVVIKPLEDYLQERTGFSGATILGDGGISLILDIYELIDLCKNKQARKNTMNSVL
jgi:chemotaxis protein histidine kinase CheA